jgi:hypothetical protein
MIVEFEDVRGIIAPVPWSSVDCLDVVDVDDFVRISQAVRLLVGVALGSHLQLKWYLLYLPENLQYIGRDE